MKRQWTNISDSYSEVIFDSWIGKKNVESARIGHSFEASS